MTGNDNRQVESENINQIWIVEKNYEAYVAYRTNLYKTIPMEDLEKIRKGDIILEKEYQCRWLQEDQKYRSLYKAVYYTPYLC